MVSPPLDEFTKYDLGKLLFSLIPGECLEMLATIFTHGAKKYDADNWKLGFQEDPEGTYRRYFDALMRHLIEAWKSIETRDSVDDESGYPHMAHALWNACVLLWFELQCQQ